ncbi:hypothetical protein HYU93_02600 [Candidatus Daviesbacteria bacterium]|nr:hypothetical protein [Candidatus Daviesbacteria bacterium]
MDDPKWLRLVTIGLVLAAMAVGYFLLTGRLASNSATKPSNQVSKASPSATIVPAASQTPTVLGQNNRVASPSPIVVVVSPSSSPLSAFGTIANRTKGGQIVQKSLPNTGFPAGLIAALSVSAVIVGWGLRRFPR